jgi:hypothetical protein
VARHEQLPAFDAHAHFKAQPHWRGLLSDGLHLSEAGNAALFEGLQAVLSEKLPDVCPDALSRDLPLHDDFEPGREVADVLGKYMAQ